MRDYVELSKTKYWALSARNNPQRACILKTSTHSVFFQQNGTVFTACSSWCCQGIPQLN